MFLIGIDFGHGETTVSCIDTNDTQKEVKHLHILDGSSSESYKVKSAVCIDADSQMWRFMRDFRDYSSSSLKIHFKAPMNEITPEQKEAFQAFIRLVFEHVLAHHQELQYDAQTGKKNFELYIACPSGWNESDPQQIKKYKDFVAEIIPVEWVIKESDAAYFKFKDQRGNIKTKGISKVLVIDIGSSTIDFTAYGPGGVSSFGAKHGASHVERSVYDYYNKEDDDFKAGKAEAEDFCRQHGINWRDGVIHYIKEQKEDFYTKELGVLSLDLPNKYFSSSFKKRVFDSVDLSKDTLENKVLAGYRAALKSDMEDVLKKIDVPDAVILTGGASRMPWLQGLVQEVFKTSEIWRDSEPSYVVSDGIACYANAVYELKNEIAKSIADFWEKNTDEVLANLLSEAFNESLHVIQDPKIEQICKDFEEGNLVYDAADFGERGNENYNGRHCTAVFVPAMRKHNKSILADHNHEISDAVNKGINEKLNAEIGVKIKEAFVQKLHDAIADMSLSFSVAIDVGNLCIENACDEVLIEKMTREIYRFIFAGNLYKDRETVEDRQCFSQNFLQMQKLIGVNLLPETLEIGVKSIKDSLEKELCLENLLQKCLFTIYK